MSTTTYRIGDKVLFNIGQHEEEGVIKGFEENASHEQVALIGYVKKTDSQPTVIHRRLESLTKVT